MNMKRIVALLSFTSFAITIVLGQKKYEMVVEKSDDTNVVIKTDEIVQTYFREQEGHIGNIEQSYLSCPDDKHPHVIDLGIGTKWACCNVGASRPEEIGGYYAWGEEEEKEVYDWNTYKHSDGNSWACRDLGNDICGTVYDVAHVKWGSNWRLPNTDDIKQLIDKCSFEEMSVNSVFGLNFIGPNGGSIFIPFADYPTLSIYGSKYGPKTKRGFLLWTGMSYGLYSAHRLSCMLDVPQLEDSPFFRCGGESVRPVFGYNPTDLVLSTTVIHGLIGDTYAVGIKSGSGSYAVESSDAGVALVTMEGAMVNVTAMDEGEATIIVTDTNSRKSATILVVVAGAGIGDTSRAYLTCPDDRHPHLIDLGLPSGTKWACCNMDTNDPMKQSPMNHGCIYSWGDTEASLTNNTLLWNNKCEHYKYKSDPIGYQYLGDDISGTSYDVAHVKWGGSWLMPSLDQTYELLDYCIYDRVKIDGANYVKFTAANGGSIILPETKPIYYYWTSKQAPKNQSYAHILCISPEYLYQVLKNYRCNTIYVRPVSYESAMRLTTNGLDLFVGENKTSVILSGKDFYTKEYAYVAESSDRNVATAVVEGRSVKVKAVGKGSAVITVSDRMNVQSATITVIVTDGVSCPDGHHPHAIDLGLPSGKKWACCNIEASTPEAFGRYFSWGGNIHVSKDEYDWKTYECCDGTEETCKDLGGDISGTVYDVAHMRWGDNWCMPNSADINELIDHATSRWTTYKGVSGRMFTGSNGNSIFLPQAGFKRGKYSSMFASGFWSSTKPAETSNSPNSYAHVFLIHPETVGLGENRRCEGFNIRAVCK